MAKDRVPIRIPMRCFLDFRPGGALCHIFENMYRFKTEKQLSKFDFDTIDDYPSNLQMFNEIYLRLIDQKCFCLPTVYIVPEINDGLRKQIVDILEDQQCEVVDNMNKATHIIHRKLSASEEDYARITFQQGKHVNMHWYYFPESYDTWLPNNFVVPVQEFSCLFRLI